MKLYIRVISQCVQKPWMILWSMFVCLTVCVFAGRRPVYANAATPSLSFLPSHSPPHFHVYRLRLMVCILTISVWKPADSPALWAWQGCRFIWEGEVTYYISSHGRSLQYFSLVMRLCSTQILQVCWLF